jgi:hypothetical protein
MSTVVWFVVAVIASMIVGGVFAWLKSRKG